MSSMGGGGGGVDIFWNSPIPYKLLKDSYLTLFSMEHYVSPLPVFLIRYQNGMQQMKLSGF